MSTIMRQAEATTKLLNVLCQDLLYELGPKLTCIECETLCEWLEAYGEMEDADTLRRSHAMQDEEGDDHWQLRQTIEKDNT